MNTPWRLFPAAPAKLAPLVGMLVGAVGAAAYWLSAQVWPTSVAVVLSMLATVLVAGGLHERGLARDVLGMLFLLFIKYNALMALSAANLAFPLPEYVALGVIMIAGHAASRALAATARMSSGDLVFALALGFAPAAIMGVPGLMGLAAAILVRMAFAAYLKRFAAAAVDTVDAVQQLTEVSFYLGALAAWKFV
jgi:adenosylcobinamide-GDP ribazoletransferase